MCFLTRFLYPMWHMHLTAFPYPFHAFLCALNAYKLLPHTSIPYLYHIGAMDATRETMTEQKTWVKRPT